MAFTAWPNMRRGCHCAEATLVEVNDAEQPTGLVFDLPAAHDCDYVTRRNKLIPLAAAFADANAQPGTDLWTQIFLGAMDSFAVAAKL